MTDSRTDPQYKLRMPAGLYDLIVSAAKVNSRSMNAEIISRLQDSFDPAKEPVAEDIVRRAATDAAQKAALAAVVNILTIFQRYNKTKGMSYEDLIEGYMETIENPAFYEEVREKVEQSRRK